MKYILERNYVFGLLEYQEIVGRLGPKPKPKPKPTLFL